MQTLVFTLFSLQAVLLILWNAATAHLRICLHLFITSLYYDIYEYYFFLYLQGKNMLLRCFCVDTDSIEHLSSPFVTPRIWSEKMQSKATCITCSLYSLLCLSSLNSVMLHQYLLSRKCDHEGRWGMLCETGIMSSIRSPTRLILPFMHLPFLAQNDIKSWECCTFFLPLAFLTLVVKQ